MSNSKADYVGEPGYPAPWATSTPREGLRDTDEARIISLTPDVCRSPSVPVPYPVVDFCGHDENYTSSVRFTGQKTMVMRSYTSHVHGDEPGVGKGVKSGTVGGISEPITHAAQVRAEGSHVIRHLDQFYMNNRNTVGEAIFIKDTRSYSAATDDDPLPGSLKLVASVSSGLALPQPTPSTPPVPRPPGQVIRPDIPQWRRLPPTKPKPPSVGAQLGRVGRFGARVGGFLGALLWPSPLADGTLPSWFQDLESPDPFRRRTAEEAERLLRINPALRPELEEWYQEEMDQLPQQQLNPVPDGDENANTGRQPLLDLGPAVRVDEDKRRRRCSTQRICFMPISPTVDRKEFRRQLKLQENALNSMTPGEMLGNRGAYLANPEGLRKLSEPLQAKTRNEYYQTQMPIYRRNFGPKWRTELDAHMETIAALHNPDMIAGGSYSSVANPLIPLQDRIGGLSENSSMGSQWRGGRSQRLANHALEQQRNGCPSVQVVLEICVDLER